MFLMASAAFCLYCSSIMVRTVSSMMAISSSLLYPPSISRINSSLYPSSPAYWCVMSSIISSAVLSSYCFKRFSTVSWIKDSLGAAKMLSYRIAFSLSVKPSTYSLNAAIFSASVNSSASSSTKGRPVMMLKSLFACCCFTISVAPRVSM